MQRHLPGSKGVSGADHPMLLQCGMATVYLPNHCTVQCGVATMPTTAHGRRRTGEQPCANVVGHCLGGCATPTTETPLTTPRGGLRLQGLTLMRIGETLVPTIGPHAPACPWEHTTETDPGESARLDVGHIGRARPLLGTGASCACEQIDTE